MGLNGWKCPHFWHQWYSRLCCVCVATKVKAEAMSKFGNDWHQRHRGSSCKLKRCPHFGDDITNVWVLQHLRLLSDPMYTVHIPWARTIWGGSGQSPTGVPLSKQRMPYLLPQSVSRSMCCMVCEWWLMHIVKHFGIGCTIVCFKMCITDPKCKCCHLDPTLSLRC